MTPKQRKLLVRNHSKSNLSHRYKMISLLSRQGYEVMSALERIDGSMAEFCKHWGVQSWRKVKRLNRLTSTSNMQ